MTKLHEALAHLKTAAKSLETALAVAEEAKRYAAARKAHTGQGEAYFRLRQARLEWMRANFG
jgi:hypothetical protein